MKATFKNGELTIGNNTIKLRDVIDTNYNELGVGEDLTYDGKCSYKIWVTGSLGYSDDMGSKASEYDYMNINIRVRDVENKKIYHDFLPINMLYVKRIYEGRPVFHGNENMEELFKCACEISHEIEKSNLLLEQAEYHIAKLKKAFINYSNIHTIDELIFIFLKLRMINYSSPEEMQGFLNSLQETTGLK